MDGLWRIDMKQFQVSLHSAAGHIDLERAQGNRLGDIELWSQGASADARFALDLVGGRFKSGRQPDAAISHHG